MSLSTPGRLMEGFLSLVNRWEVSRQLHLPPPRVYLRTEKAPFAIRLCDSQTWKLWRTYKTLKLYGYLNTIPRLSSPYFSHLNNHALPASFL